jgi:serine/threonine protein kinase
MGTLGYIDPMYLSSGKFRPASDVYALGVTILQLVTGHDNPRGLIDYIDAAVESNALSQVNINH